MVRTIVAIAASQGPAGLFVVRVNVVVPARISAADGVYTAFNVELLGLNVPPLPVQDADVALPPITPAIATVLPAQIVCGPPALTIGMGLMVNTIVELTSPQGPPLSGSRAVYVKLTVPAVISAALGV